MKKMRVTLSTPSGVPPQMLTMACEVSLELEFYNERIVSWSHRRLYQDNSNLPTLIIDNSYRRPLKSIPKMLVKELQISNSMFDFLELKENYF